ncbi:MAG: CNNM domain-containing protein [Planctomycetota bacterium]
MIDLLLLLLLLAFSFFFSGAETGVYSLSRLRLDADVREGRRAARLLARLVRGETGILITLLVGNNLVNQLATQLCLERVTRWDAFPPGGRELLVTLVLTPLVFFFSELLPKDLFRRRPHRLLYPAAPLLLVVRTLFLPVVWPLRILSEALERLLGLGARDVARVLAREEVVDALHQGAREGALPASAAAMAYNVLVLRETPLARVMIPWARVEAVDLDLPPAAVRGRLAGSAFTRLPAVRRGAAGAEQVVGYLHQLEVLAAPEGGDPAGALRPLLALLPDLPVDRALAEMRSRGARLALVGIPERPAGLVSLADLVATLSRDATP